MPGSVRSAAGRAQARLRLLLAPRWPARLLALGRVPLVAASVLLPPAAGGAALAPGGADVAALAPANVPTPGRLAPPPAAQGTAPLSSSQGALSPSLRGALPSPSPGAPPPAQRLALPATPPVPSWLLLPQQRRACALWALPGLRALGVAPAGCAGRRAPLLLPLLPGAAWPPGPLAAGSTAAAAAAAALQRRPAAAALAHVEAAPLVQWLGEQPGGALWAPLGAALGLQQLDAAAVPQGGGRTALCATLVTGPAPQGLLAALAPPVLLARPPHVPAAALAWAVAAVQPQVLWQALEAALAAAYPLPYALGRVQLDALEQEMGVSWLQDVLGAEVRRWSGYVVAGGGGAVLEVRDGAAAIAYLGAALQVVAALTGHFAVEAGGHGGAPGLVVRLQAGGRPRAGCLLGAPQALVWAPSAGGCGALMAAWRRRAAALPRGERASAQGEVAPAWLRAAGLLRPAAALPWTLQARPEGAEVQALYTVAPSP